MDDKYKYAIVRLKETEAVDFFTHIAARGYTDVSFVSHLSQTMARPDPNYDANANGSTASSSVKNECLQVADLEDRCSVVATPFPEDSPPHPPPKKPSQLDLLINPRTEPQMKAEQDQYLENAEDLVASASNDLISSLFTVHSLPTMNSADLSNFHNQFALTPQNGGGKQMFQSRMKGWQREYIKEVIQNGHYPSEDELRDIEQKCDLSRKQVLRFIAKRLVNPNRKPRSDRLEDNIGMAGVHETAVCAD